MDEVWMRQIREAIENFPPRPDLDGLIESGDIVKVPGGYQAPTEKGRKAIEKYAIGFKISNKGKPLVYRLSIRRKRKPSM
ncbi:hypothetical protein [Pseudomonas akapageensis]|uniref:hypothetical protein n=1 Tax=Pseudomonas akapageensis TaxID=2609961 RepID=UPI00140C8ECC|nr:hypothetical protein [Pseudomonas akapageensis]